MWGRQRELSAIDDGLRDLSEGRGGLVLITGEPGIGKTSLCDALSGSARERGIAVHWGRASEVGGAPPFWPFIQVLRSICRDVEDAALADTLGPEAGALAGLIPELRNRVPAVHTADAMDRFELFDSVGAFLRRMASTAPRVMLLDDLHAADPSSLELLHFIARELRDEALLIAGTYRDAEARLSPEVRQTLARVAREALLLPLRRLDRSEVSDLVTQATGSAPSGEHADAIYEQTEGNPLFLRELLMLQGSARRQAEGIREVVRTRLSLLAADARDVLGAAAVLGRECAMDDLVALAERPQADVARALRSAADAGIVERIDPPGRWRFSHVLLRDGLYDDLDADRRRALHRRAAAVQRQHGDDSALAEVAHHLLHALPTVTVGDATDAVLVAGDNAVRLLAFEDACALLERTSRWLADTPGEQSRLYDVLLALGVAQIRGGNVKAGKRSCLRAADLARQLGDGERFAQAVLGSACEYVAVVRDAPLIALLEEALDALRPGDGALRARCMAQLAAERQPEPDTQQPIALAREAVAMARRIGDQDTLRTTLSNAGLAMMVFGDPAERMAREEECLRLAMRVGDKIVALRAHLLLQLTCWELGDVAGAQAHVAAYEQLVQLRYPEYRWVSRMIHLATHIHEGRFAQAEAIFHDAAELWRSDEGRGAEMLTFRADLCRASEHYDQLPQVVAQLRAGFGAIQGDLGALIGEMHIAQLYARAGDRQRARAQLDSIQAHPLFDAITEASWLSLLADACHLVGDVALAERIHPLLESRAPRFVHHGPVSAAIHPPFSRPLGLLAQTLGRHHDAVGHLEDTVAALERVGMRAYLARARYELAQALLARGAHGDGDQARRLLGEARALAEALGQTALLSVMSDEPAGADTTHAAPPSLANDLVMQREGELWTIASGALRMRLRDSRGLQVLSRLLAEPGRELHVLQLVAPDATQVQDGGDAGELLDERAIQHYRSRLLDLRQELDEAEANADIGRSERARSEIDALTAELARAVGLGGRTRRAGNPAERARTTVQKRIKSALSRIAEQDDALGKYLQATIRTGTFCSYQPLPSPAPRIDDDRARLQSEKLASLGELVAGIAHQMNTPLGALRANVDMAQQAWSALREALADEALAEVLSKHKRLMRALQVLERTQGVAPEATQRIAGVVEQLQSFARVDRAEVGELDMCRAIDDAIALRANQIGDRIEIIRKLRPVPVIVCRASLINQVVMCLVENAIQAIDGDGTIRVETSSSGDEVVLCISDSGCGIAPEHLDRIFDPGFTTRSIHVGLGLGLSLSRRIVEEHGGRIEVDGRVDRGASFTVRLPRYVNVST